MTQKLAQTLDGTGVTSSCIDPGLVDTAYMQDAPAPLKALLWATAKPADYVVKTHAFVAVHPSVANFSGKLWKYCQEVPFEGQETDVEVGDVLWKESEQLVQKWLD